MKLPLNLVFFLTTAGHFGHLNVYQTTVKHYRAKLGGSLDLFQNRFAHIKVRKAEQDRLPDMIDFLLDNDIKPVVTGGEWARGLSHGAGILEDVHRVFNREDVHAAPFSFWVESDSPINVKTGGTLAEYLSTAVAVVNGNKDILSIRFQREGVGRGTPISDLFDMVSTWDFQPTVARTRDLWLASKIIADHPAQFAAVQCEAAFRAASDTLSYSGARYLCFNPDRVTSHHIGAPDYATIIQGKDFQGLDTTTTTTTT